MQKITVAVNERGIRIGEDHQNARYTNREIQHVLDMRDEGKSYGFIATVMDMPKSTVASICRGCRRCQFAVAYKTITCGG
jgi:hypothetical protein